MNHTHQQATGKSAVTNNAVLQSLPRLTDTQGPIEGFSFKPLSFRDVYGRDVVYPVRVSARISRSRNFFLMLDF